ncbi:MAG TPA: hypothetical protein VMA36_04310 [Candidatus Limnocylindria bacterium]|nr:hypothetical protein [Candidatus Limnocylindria bacterium]
MNSQTFVKATKSLENVTQRLTPKASRATLREAAVASEAPPVPPVPGAAPPGWAAGWRDERDASSANVASPQAESRSAPSSQSKASGSRLRTFKSVAAFTVSRGGGLRQEQIRGFEEWASSYGKGEVRIEKTSAEPLPRAQRQQQQRVTEAVQRHNAEHPGRPLPTPTSVSAWDFNNHTGSHVELQGGGLAVHTGRGQYQEVTGDQRHLVTANEHGIQLSELAQTAQQRGRSVIPNRQASGDSQQQQQQQQRSRTPSRGGMGR